MSDLIKVSATSQTTAVAGAIAGIIRERHGVAVQAIGASAVNQAVKAIAIAHGYLEGDGLNIWCLPSFVQVDVSGLERTAVRFSVEVREHGEPTSTAEGRPRGLTESTSVGLTGIQPREPMDGEAEAPADLDPDPPIAPQPDVLPAPEPGMSGEPGDSNEDALDQASVD